MKLGDTLIKAEISLLVHDLPAICVITDAVIDAVGGYTRY